MPRGAFSTHLARTSARDAAQRLEDVQELERLDFRSVPNTLHDLEPRRRALLQLRLLRELRRRRNVVGLARLRTDEGEQRRCDGASVAQQRDGVERRKAAAREELVARVSTRRRGDERTREVRQLGRAHQHHCAAERARQQRSRIDREIKCVVIAAATGGDQLERDGRRA